MEISRTCSEYHTPAGIRPGWFRRLLPSAAPAFYARMAWRVGGAVSKAARGRYDAAQLQASSAAVAGDIEACGGVLHVTGLDNLSRAAGPVVFVANHMSTLETFVLPCLILPWKPLAFIVKEHLVRHLVFGPIMRALDPITVSRANSREDYKTMMTAGADRLAAGDSICVFPQSTRRPAFAVSKFNSIGAKLAQRAQVPILPVALKTDFWETGRTLRDIGPIHPERAVHFHFGPPIAPSDNARVMHEQTLAFMEAALPALGVPCEP